MTPATLYAQKQGEAITLNFVNAEIDAVARTMGVITGRNMVVDPRVKGTMNLSSEKALSPAAAYNQFVTTLRLQSVVVVESQGIFKVVPEADAKLQTSVVSAGGVTPESWWQPNCHANFQPKLRLSGKFTTYFATTYQPQQYHQRQSWQQLAHHH